MPFAENRGTLHTPNDTSDDTVDESVTVQDEWKTSQCPDVTLTFNPKSNQRSNLASSASVAIACGYFRSNYSR